MAWSNDLHMNKLSFDVTNFMGDFDRIIQICTNWLSDRVIELFRHELWKNSLASKEMKNTARQAVREISRKVVAGILELEIGVDEAYAHSMGTQFYVRTMVSIYGNLSQGPIYTKPGQYTWRKDVRDYHLNTTSKKRKRLRQFDQRGRSKKIVNGVLQNVDNSSNKYLKDYVDMIEANISANLFDQNVIVR